MTVVNIFHDMPATLHEEQFTTLAHGGSVKIERIISNGHASPESGWYDQVWDEWVIVLRGSAVLSFPTGNDVEMNAGDYIHLPAHCKHKVSSTAPETVWLAVHYLGDGEREG